jgi:hypothetical protein
MVGTTNGCLCKVLGRSQVCEDGLNTS